MKITKLLGIALIGILGFGQNNPNPQDFLPKITPPSPEAYALGNYGNVPVGLFTGSPNVQIPLLEFKTKNINIPFSLSYSSNGIKVDDVNSKVGLGWNLIGGGVITRMIRDLPDEESMMDDYPLKHLDLVNISPNNEILNTYFNIHGENEGYDTESDLFNFSFLNFSGKFYFDKNNNIIQIEKSNLKIEINDNNGINPFSFKITDGNGVQYFFHLTERTMLRTSGDGHSIPNTNTTAWLLTNITYPDNNVIHFEYDNYNEYYITSESQQVSRSFPYFQSCTGIQGLYAKSATLSPIYSHNYRAIGYRLRKIKTDNPIEGYLLFDYDNSMSLNSPDPKTVLDKITYFNKNNETINFVKLNYFSTLNDRIFLESIHFLDSSKKYSFEYIQPNNFPKRLDKGQDEWGYFNGANNSNLIPEVNGYGFENINFNFANKIINPSVSKLGLLNKIIYPTKGYTLINYEPNNYFGDVKQLPTQQNTSISVSTDQSIRLKTTEHTFFSHFGHEVEMKGDSYFYNCDSDFDTGRNHHKSVLSVFCVEDAQEMGLYSYDQYGNGFVFGVSAEIKDLKKVYFFAEKDKTYQIRLKNSYNCTYGYLNIKYYNQNYTISRQNILAAGNRVESTTDYTHANDLNPILKQYKYNYPNDINRSSGDIGQTPYYFDIRKFKDGNCFKKDIVITSSSLSNLYDTSGSHIYYKYVNISEGNNYTNGYIENEFIINRDYREHIYRGSDEFRNVPFSNFGWDNGKLKSTKIYAKEGTQIILKKETINTYSKTLETPIAINFAIRNPYPGVFAIQNQDVCRCNINNVSESYSIKHCTTLHIHKKDANGNCIANNATNTTSIIEHPCFGENIGELISIPSIFHLDIMPYKYFSYSSQLTNTLDKEYFSSGGSISHFTNFFYDNNDHLQLTKKTTTNSTGETIKTKYSYAHEMGNQAMIDKNMIAIPLKTESFKGTEKLAEQETVYNDWGNGILAPKEVKTAKGSATVETRVKYNVLDNTNGNPLEVQQEGGHPICYIWGYNKTLPIAKIENATYAQVQSYVANLQTLSNGTNEGNLITALDALRAALPNAMVTTYTHKPLIGLSTVTDPKGDKITYHYDNFNRLQFVKDKNENILSENEYHYKN